MPSSCPTVQGTTQPDAFVPLLVVCVGEGRVASYELTFVQASGGRLAPQSYSKRVLFEGVGGRSKGLGVRRPVRGTAQWHSLAVRLRCHWT